MASAIKEWFSNKEKTHFWDAAEIYPNKLYYGGGWAAQDLEELKKHKVTHILNVADDVPNYHHEKFVYINLRVKDMGQDTGISRVFEKAFQELDAIMKDDKSRVLVHCAAGRNRSATLTIAYVMHREGATLDAALKKVNSKRRVFIMKDNRYELMQFEISKFGKNTVKMERFLQT